MKLITQCLLIVLTFSSSSIALAQEHSAQPPVQYSPLGETSGEK